MGNTAIKSIYITRIVIGQKSTNRTIHGRKLVWFSHAVYTRSEYCQYGFRFVVRGGGGGGGVGVQRFLDVSRFLYPGGWQV